MSSGKFNESKPTSFEPIKRNALATFDLETKKINNRETYSPRPVSFQWVLKSNKAIQSPITKYDPDDDRSQVEAFMKRRFLNIAKDVAPSTTLDDLEIVRYSENEPKITDRRLEPNRVPSNIERVAQRGTYLRRDDSTLDLERVKQSGALTVDTVRAQIRKWSGDDGKTHYYLKFLDHLIKNKGKGFQPTVLVKDIEQMRAAGFRGVTELLNDFGEIAGPVGLLSASINGNAVRVLPDFFKVNGVRPSTQDLMQEATIHFHASQGHMLVDSYIEYRGRVMRVSSKNAGEELSGGQGASVDGIFQSLQEINSMPLARQRFEELIGGGKYDQTLKNLRLVARVFEGTEGDRDNLKGYLAQFELVNTLNTGSLTDQAIAVEPADRRILQLIWRAADSSDVGMNDFKHLIGAALGNRPDRDQISDTGVGKQLSRQQFTPRFAQLLRSFNLNRWGEPGTSGVEKFSYEPAPGQKVNVLPNAKRGWWRRLKKALVYRVSRLINSDPRFSELCTWILNHGAFCQIDTRYSLGGDNKNQLVVTNISATWPSNRVDSVRLMPLPSGEGFRYKLDINGGRGFTDMQATDTDIDYDFGFKTKRDRDNARDRMLPTQLDLARNKGDWRVIDPKNKAINQIPDAKERKRGLRASRSSLILKGLFSDLADMGYLGFLPEPEYIDREMRNQDLVQAYTEPTIELAKRLIAGEFDGNSRLRNGIRYAINALWGMPVEKDFEHLFTEDRDDDDDDEEEIVDPARDQFERMRYYQIARRHAAIAKTLANMLYYSGRVADALASGLDLRDNQAWNQRLEDFYKWVRLVKPGNEQVVNEFEQIIASRIRSNKRAPVSIGASRFPVVVKVNRQTASRNAALQPQQAVSRAGRGRPLVVNNPSDPLPDQAYTLRARINKDLLRPNTTLGRWYQDLPQQGRDGAARQLTRQALLMMKQGSATWKSVYDLLPRIAQGLQPTESRSGAIFRGIQTV